MGKTNFSLEAFRVWAARLHGGRDKEAWERVFAPGHRLWRGLTSIHEFIEHYGTGGGLCRPLMAEFLAEAAAALRDDRLRPLADCYQELGRGWSELADAALPDDVPEFAEAKEQYTRRSELLNSGGTREEVRAAWARLAELEQAARARFPLSDSDCDALCARLSERVMALYQAEVAAHEELGRLAGPAPVAG